MPPRKEPCRNFQRGFCQYGERCKFLHANQQQAKPNPFGFGTQTNSQPQKPNPFGFGVQNNSQTTSQFKPGENKWSRFSQINGGNSTAPPKKDNQSSAANHVCTDSESCKRQIREDFEQEKPLWKLTCYGHSKYGPCDIVGDLSYEELRAAVYDEAKRGASIQSIVEKERSLLSSKLIEFENLLRNPYTPPQGSTHTTQNAIPGTNANVFPQMSQNNGPPSLSSFSQLGSNFNAGFQARPATPSYAFGQVNQSPSAPNNAFGQVNQSPPAPNNAFGQVGQLPTAPSNAFGQVSQSLTAPNNAFGQVSQSPAAPGNAFGQVSQFQAPTQISNASQNSFAFGNPGQPSTQSYNSFPATTTTFGNVFSAAATPQNHDIARQQPFGSHNPSTNVVPQPASVVPIMQNSPNSSSIGDNSIWYKDEWRAGEIPEEAPPDGVVH